MFKVPVLLYASKCKYSLDLLDSLPNSVVSKIVIINIDRDPVSKERPRIYHDIKDIIDISVVPTLVISENTKFEGKQILTWVKAQEPQARILKQVQAPKHVPRQNVEENYTRLSNIQFDVSPISHEEEMALKSGRGLSSITDDKHIVSENYENVVAQRQREKDEANTNRYVCQ